MTISSSDILNLPVFTVSGQHLGRVSSFDVEAENDLMVVVRYYVRTGLIKGLWHEQLIIHKSQIVSIDNEKMVVEDSVLRDPASELKDANFATPVAK